MAAKCFHVLLKHLNRDVPGPLDRRDTRLGYPNTLGKLALGHASLLAKSSQPGGEAQFVLDLPDAAFSPWDGKDLLLPLLETHRCFPFGGLVLFVGQGFVSAIDVFTGLGWLAPGNVDRWRATSFPADGVVVDFLERR